MSRSNMSFGGFSGPEGERPQRGEQPLIGGGTIASSLVALVLIGAVVYAGYYWFVRRVVVGPGEVLVLLKKHGTQSLPGEQVIIPRRPTPQTDPEAYAQWQKTYGNVNGIHEEVYPEGTYFQFSPFRYEREIINIGNSAIVPTGKIGIVVRKFGEKLPPGQVLADPALNQRGPLPVMLQPGRHNDYANPYAYEIKLIDPVVVDPGHRGVVTIMAAAAAEERFPARSRNEYLVGENERGVQPTAEPEGFRYVNPFERRITPISIRSQRFEMTGDGSIRFPSADSFEIRLEGFVEWSIIPDRLPETYVKYSEGSELIPLLEKTIILPYARSFCRVVGSQYSARDFISGDTKLRFQREFEQRLREACNAQGVEVLQALVRDIIPPEEIKQPINEREIARQRIAQYEQQIKVADSQAKLATQEETATQNQAIGEANREVVTIVMAAEEARGVVLTRARQELAVARLQLEAAQKQADALTARGQADANVILLNKQAEAEPLRQQIAAFGDGDTYARYYFYQAVAPAVKSILSNTDGPFAELFGQFMIPAARPAGNEPSTVTGVQP